MTYYGVRRVIEARRRLSGIIRDTGWTGASEVVTLLTGLVVLQVLIVGLGPALYGRYAAVTALSSILTMLSSTWVTFLLLQYTLQGGRDVREAFRVALGLVIPAAVLALALGAAVGQLLIPSLSVHVIASFVAAELVGGVLFMVSGGAVQAAVGLPAATRVRLLAVLTRFVVVVGVGMSGRASLPLLGAALLLGNTTVGIIVFLVISRRLQLPRRPARPRWADARQGLPYAGVLASSAVQEDSDKIFLAAMANPVDAGLYAAAYRVVQLAFIPIRAVMASSHPRFLINTPGVPNEHLRRAARFTVPTAAYGLVATIGIVVLAPVVPLVFGEEYRGTLPLLVALAPLVLFRTLSLFPPNALLGLGRYALRFKAVLACTLVNVALNAALISAFSVSGAIMATLCTEAVVVVTLWSCLLRAQRQHDAEHVDRERSEPAAESVSRSGP